MKLLFGTYFQMDRGWGREIIFTLSGKRVSWHSDDGLIHYFLERIDELQDRIEKLETKKGK